MRESLLHVGLLCWIATTWFIGGRRLLPRKLRGEEPFLVWSSALALVAGTTAVLLTAFATFHLLRPGPIWAVQAGWTVLAITEGRALAGVGRPAWQRRSPWTLLLGAILAIAIILTLVGTLAPPTSVDATVYHLRVPREYLRAGRILALADDVHSFQPLYVEMLFAFGMVIRDDVLSALLHWLLGIGAALTAGAWARRLGARSPMVAVAIFAVSPLIVWESTSSFIDLGLTLFASLGLLWATRAGLGPPSVGLAAVFAGLAAGSKFTGCAMAALVGLVAFAYALPDRRRAVLRFVAIGAIAAALAAPWYVRNAILTGNPLYPVGNQFFGLPLERLSNWTYGYGRDLLHLLSSPFDLIWRGEVFDLGWAFGPAYLALVPIGLLFNRQSQIHRIAAGVMLVFWVFWFYSSPQTRLLLPILPLGAGVAAAGFDALEDAGGWTRVAARLTVLVSAAVGLAAAGVVAAGTAKVVSGAESRATYLRRMALDYVAYEQINRLLGPEARPAVEGATNLYYLQPRGTIVQNEEPSALAARGLTHLIWIDACDAKAPAKAEGKILWAGRYLRPGARFQGGAAAVERCAELIRLTD
jgi:hypothetical protein